MSRIKITIREKEILKNIYSDDKYVTISSIAEKLEISSRTVLRELGEIEGWLNIFNCGLDKKAGIGIRFTGSNEDKIKMIEALEGGVEVKSFSPKERQVIILGELLQEKEPIKLFSFTRSLNVTEGTVSNDLDKAEIWLKSYNLNLVRKPGLGIYIEGKEEEIRKAIIDLIHENIDEVQLLDIIREKFNRAQDSRERLLNLIEKETVLKFEELIYDLEKASGYKLTDNAFVGLIVHLALAIERIRKNEKITMDSGYLKQLKCNSEFKIAADLTTRISEVFKIEIPEDEIGYITMHLMGSKVFGNRKTNEELDLLVNELINIAEVETGSFLKHDEQFIDGLTNHLDTAINRLKMKMNIRNPLLNEIKEHYPELFNLTIKCVVPVESYLNVRMPDSEIAYIAMHIGAALQRKESFKKQTYRVVVSCATGIGTSQLLASRLDKEFDNIIIADVISTMHINEKILDEMAVDFIISTVPIERAALPIVVINPLLLERDKEKITSLLKEIKPNNAVKQEIKYDSMDVKEKLSRLKLYTDGIIQILTNLFINEYHCINSIEELIHDVSNAVASNAEEAILIQNSLTAREQIGSTVISGFSSMLLHSRTSGVKELYFGAVRIKTGLNCISSDGKLEKIKFAIVMLAPEVCDKLLLDILSFLSSKLIEETAFIKLLENGTKESVYKSLNMYMDEFYKLKSN